MIKDSVMILGQEYKITKVSALIDEKYFASCDVCGKEIIYADLTTNPNNTIPNDFEESMNAAIQYEILNAFLYETGFIDVPATSTEKRLVLKGKFCDWIDQNGYEVHRALREAGIIK